MFKLLFFILAAGSLPLSLMAIEPAAPLAVRVKSRSPGTASGAKISSDPRAQKKTPRARGPVALAPPKLSAEEMRINSRIAQAFEVEEEARFGKPPAVKLSEDHIPRVYAPATGNLVPKSKAQCETTPDASKKLGPVRSQGGLGWCFAVVAADLLSAETGKRLSHADLALQFYRNVPNMKATDRFGNPMRPDPSVIEFWSGVTDQAVKQGAERGVCTEAEVSSDDFMLETLTARNLDIGRDIVPLKAVGANVLHSIEESVGKTLDQMAEFPQETCFSVQDAMMLLPKLNSFQVIAALSSARSKEEAIHWLFQQGCRREPLGLKKDWKFRTFQSLPERSAMPGTDLLPKIDEALKAGKPVAMGFDAKRYSAYGANDPSVKRLLHAAILVKREFRAGQCMYLVRDSQGPGCMSFAPPYNDADHCERGQYWVTEQDLAETTLEVSRFE
ncbi:MAG: hypothetical protein EOP11_09565 [Proteobacteria bacterium]|nr:MAG: hypothetical protein EOP11_09565 [Pseudomonadota bacterium]